MPNVLDYVRWRGDLSFTQDPPNAVDALIFSALVYLRFGAGVTEADSPVSLPDAAAEFFSLPDYKNRARAENDRLLLQAAANSARFGACKLWRFREEFIPEEAAQFAAVCFLLPDGSAVIAFRGTDNTLVGWKEDFSMSFRQVIPAQLMAQQYTHDVWAALGRPMMLCGHSKGGNLAVFAAARSSPMLQADIRDVYNNDGPGFSEYMLGDPGYAAMVPRIRTFVPQSSIIGMIMEHEEPYTIVRSTQVGIMQHDIFSWEVIGKELLPMEALTADSRFLNRTIRNWLDSMDLAERSRMVDTLFGLLMSGETSTASGIFQPKNVRRYIREMETDEKMRKGMKEILLAILEAAKKAMQEMNAKPEGSTGELPCSHQSASFE